MALTEQQTCVHQETNPKQSTSLHKSFPEESAIQTYIDNLWSCCKGAGYAAGQFGWGRSGSDRELELKGVYFCVKGEQEKGRVAHFALTKTGVISIKEHITQRRKPGYHSLVFHKHVRHHLTGVTKIVLYSFQ